MNIGNVANYRAVVLLLSLPSCTFATTRTVSSVIAAMRVSVRTTIISRAAWRTARASAIIIRGSATVTIAMPACRGAVTTLTTMITVGAWSISLIAIGASALASRGHLDNHGTTFPLFTVILLHCGAGCILIGKLHKLHTQRNCNIAGAQGMHEQ